MCTKCTDDKQKEVAGQTAQVDKCMVVKVLIRSPLAAAATTLIDSTAELYRSSLVKNNNQYSQKQKHSKGAANVLFEHIAKHF